MKQIKFRVWDKERSVMFGVDQLAFGDNGELISIYSEGPDYSNDPEALMGDEPDLDKAVLMQFTGLHDRDGAELYEGDIVDAYIHGETHGDLYEIAFVNGVFDYILLITPNLQHPYAGYPYPPECKLIGNIYENPELLEVAEDE